MNQIDTYDNSKVIGISTTDELVYELTELRSNTWARLGIDDDQYISVAVGNNHKIYGVKKNSNNHIRLYDPSNRQFRDIPGIATAEQIGPGAPDVLYYIGTGSAKKINCKHPDGKNLNPSDSEYENMIHIACGKTKCLSVKDTYKVKLIELPTPSCSLPSGVKLESVNNPEMIMVDVNEANQIWAIEKDTGNVFYRVGITSSSELGTKWINIPDVRLEGIAVGKNCTYGITKEAKRLVYFCK